MSFLKRFVGDKPGSSKSSNPSSKGCKELDVNSKITGLAMASEDELSLFSGMTFTDNCQSSHSQSTEDEHHRSNVVQGVQASQELEEAFQNLDFNVTKGYEVKKETVFNSESEKESVTASSGQQGRKKKRTQAKRPGYARDSKNISHPKGKPTEAAKVTLDQAATVQKTNDSCVASRHTSKTEIKGKIPLDLPSKDEAEHESFQGKTDENEDKCEGDQGVSKHKGTQQLYSIGTPSSSEENLVEAGKDHKEHGSMEKLSENIQEEKELKENVGSEGNKTFDLNRVCLDPEIIQDLETLEKSFESRQESKDSIIEEKGIEEDGDIVKENISENSYNEEKDQQTCLNKEESLEEERLKEREQTYDLNLDAEDKSSLVEQDMQFRISGLSDEDKVLKELEHELIQNYSNSSKAYLDKQRELESLTQEEAEALANDNYDLAEELSVKMEDLKESLENAKYKLPAVDTKVQQALQLRSDLALKRLSIHREAQVSLEELREEQACALDAFNEENNAKISKERQRLNTERQRLDRAGAHLQLDTKHLEKEERMLGEEINQRTEEFVNRRELLKEEREKIRSEIEEVERRLTQLRMSESQCSEDIEVEELKINEIIAEFLPQKEPLNKQRRELEDQQKLLKTDLDSLTLANETFDKSVELWSKKKERLTEFLNSLQTTISSNDSSINVLEKQRGEIEEFLCLKHLSFAKDTSLDKLKSSVKQTSQQIKSLTSKMALSERNIASLRKRVTEIEDQISDRNEAKDIAKKERNFKEAKRLKEESEALNAEGIESQEKLEGFLKELNQDTGLLQTKQKEYEDITEQLKEIEYESDLKLVNSAAKVVQGLQQQIVRYTDNEFLYMLLTAEISTCQNLINELCSKHSISVPVIEELQPRDVTRQSDELENINREVDEESCKDGRATYEYKDIEVQEENQDELLSQLDELEGKLEAVVEMEDFDEADRIQQEIIQLKSKLEERS